MKQFRFFTHGIIVLCFLILICLVPSMYAHDIYINGRIERSFVIVTASYNNHEWYKKNLHSVLYQNYSNYRMIYIDDCSPDGTGRLVEEYLREKKAGYRVELIKNNQRLLAMENLYHAIHSCDDTDIIVILDGDDWLAHHEVLSYLNQVYADPNVWITYGQYQEYPTGTMGFNGPIPIHIVRNNLFRHQYSAFSHVRTFYAKLFKHIAQEDLMYQDKFLVMSADIASMLPMMEMARDHFKFITTVLYIYNGANNLNDHKVSKELQRGLDLYVRAKPPYEKLNSLF